MSSSCSANVRLHEGRRGARCRGVDPARDAAQFIFMLLCNLVLRPSGASYMHKPCLCLIPLISRTPLLYPLLLQCKYNAASAVTPHTHPPICVLGPCLVLVVSCVMSPGEDEPKRRGQVLTLLAEQALQCHDYKVAYIHCQDLMATGTKAANRRPVAGQPCGRQRCRAGV